MLLLALFTLGLYHLFWMFMVSSYLKHEKKQDIPSFDYVAYSVIFSLALMPMFFILPEDETTFTSMIVFILGCLVGVLLWWQWKFAKAIANYLDMKYFNKYSVYFLLLVLDDFSSILFQHQFNKILDKESKAKKSKKTKKK